MAIDFNAFLNRKYDVMEQEADARSSVAKNLGMPAVTMQASPTVAPAQNSVTGVIDVPTSTLSSLTKSVERTSNFMGQQEDEFGKPIRAKKGLTKVPGKGDGTKDTVKAKLAPGEAVLNKAAADGMGRGLIAALNKMGAKKMGLV